MTSTITERLAAARRRAWDAREAARTAAQEERDLELEEATQHARAKLDDALTGSELSPKLHGELVASAAREHGAACARAGSIQDVTWRHLRVALTSLVKRVQVAERERDEARAQLAALREAACAIAASKRTVRRVTPSGISLVLVDGLPCIRGGGALDAALADTEAVAREHDARTRAAALREAADRVGLRDGGIGMQCGPHSLIEDWLRALADEVERGGER